MKKSALSLAAVSFTFLTIVTPSAYAINGTNPRPSATTTDINGTNPRPSAAAPINGTNPRPSATTGMSLPGWADAILAILNLG